MKNLKTIASFVLIILASIYLTFLIDLSTLNTWLKRVYVFCYFIIMSCLAVYIYRKYSKISKYTLISLLCAVALVIIGQNVFLPTKGEHVIYIQSTEASDGNFQEAWFVDIEVDGEKKALSSLEINDKVNWTYSADYDDYFFAPGVNNGNIISFTVIAKEVKLSFGTNEWSENVRVYDNYECDEIISLYSEEKSVVDKTVSTAKVYTIFERILYNIGSIIVFTFVFEIVILFISKFIRKKLTRSNEIA